MKKHTLKQLIASTNIPAPLVRSVVKQMGGLESFQESAQDITKHGIDGGFGDFIYYADTVPFAKKNMKHIMEMAKEQAQDVGVGLFEMLKGFKCMQVCSEEEIAEAIYKDISLTLKSILKGFLTGDMATNVLNCLAWYAGEEVARAYCDLLERD